MNARIKKKIYETVFEADTKAGKLFDLLLLITILISVAVVIFESVKDINEQYKTSLKIAEWAITGIFTIEYIVRILIVDKKLKYILSYYGIIDLLSILPSFLSFFMQGAYRLSVIRSFRLLRVFRILRLSQFVSESNNIVKALKASKHKISIFFLFIVMVVIIVGTIMFLIEGEKNGFTSIPQSIYWAVVTLTTVGYGDIAPLTVAGKFIASLMMILGYAIIAVPTGIVSAEFSNIKKDKKMCNQVCSNCLNEIEDPDAKYCKYCGNSLDN